MGRAGCFQEPHARASYNLLKCDLMPELSEGDAAGHQLSLAQTHADYRIQ